MKPELVEKKTHYGQLAEELGKSRGYQEILKRSTEKKESLLKEAMDSKTIEDLRYASGFIAGLEFSEKLVGQWSQEARNLRK